MDRETHGKLTAEEYFKELESLRIKWDSENNKKKKVIILKEFNIKWKEAQKKMSQKQRADKQKRKIKKGERKDIRFRNTIKIY